MFDEIRSDGDRALSTQELQVAVLDALQVHRVLSIRRNKTDTNDARWIVPHDLPINGGTLATAGNLVFHGTATGMVQAFTADTGKILWASKIGSSVQAGPITYMIKGKQYLLVPAGASGQDRLVFPRYGASPDAHGPNRLVAYVLGGTGTVPRNDNEIAKEVPPPPPQTANAANIRWGKS